MSNILIQADHISKIYDPDIMLKRGKNEYALRGVDLVIEEGDFISVMGPSGSGKSTLVNCISSLDRISKGHLKLFGKDVLSTSNTVLSEFRNKYLGFIFQNHNLIPTLSIYDNIAVPLMLNEVDNKEIDQRVQKIAQQLGIEKTLEKKPGQCSGGQCQRAAIARAVIHQPKIVICDEPTGNLDSKNSHDVLRNLSEMNKNGTTIVLVTHDPLIASYSKKMMYLYDGSIINVVKREDKDQIDYYHEILSITSKDNDIKKILSNSEYVEANENMFKEYIDVYMMLNGKKYDDEIAEQYRPLVFYEDCMIYTNPYYEKIKIPLDSIHTVKLNISRKLVGVGWFTGNNYYVSFDFIGDMTYKFKAMNQENLIEVLDYIVQRNYNIIDERNIISEYKKYPSRMERVKYFDTLYKDLK